MNGVVVHDYVFFLWMKNLICESNQYGIGMYEDRRMVRKAI